MSHGTGAPKPMTIMNDHPDTTTRARPCMRCGLPVDYVENGEPIHVVCATLPPRPKGRVTVAEAGPALLLLAEEIVRLDARDPLDDRDRGNDDAWPSSEAVDVAMRVRYQARQVAA